jgi:excisionase family DNA binding protein
MCDELFTDRASPTTGGIHFVGCGCPNTTMTLLTVKDMATRLQVKEKTIYVWASQRKIPSVKINGVIRFDLSEIEQWLQKCHVSVGVPCTSLVSTRRGSATSVDHLIESAKRAVYTSRGETRPIASPDGREGANGAR